MDDEENVGARCSSDLIDALYGKGMAAGAWGGKVLGGGSGGCVMFFVPRKEGRDSSCCCSSRRGAGLKEFKEIPYASCNPVLRYCITATTKELYLYNIISMEEFINGFRAKCRLRYRIFRRGDRQSDQYSSGVLRARWKDLCFWQWWIARDRDALGLGYQQDDFYNNLSEHTVVFKRCDCHQRSRRSLRGK